jgi:hypothetical protein
MQLEKRLELLVRLGEYMLGKDEKWKEVKARAQGENGCFIQEFIQLSVENISGNYLQLKSLESLVQKYRVSRERALPKKVGIVMAGNIPMVGFHRLPGNEPHFDTVLVPGELITAVTLPKPLGGKHFYLKVRDRASFAFALISVAAESMYTVTTRDGCASASCCSVSRTMRSSARPRATATSVRMSV